MKAKFGGGKTTAFALVYDSLDEKKKYDSKTGLRRVSTLFRYSNETLLFTAIPPALLVERPIGVLVCLKFSQSNNNYY